MLAGIPYTVDTGEKLVNETFGPNNIRRKSSGAQELHAVEIADGRGQAFSLDGCVQATAPSARRACCASRSCPRTTTTPNGPRRTGCESCSPRKAKRC